MRVTLLERSQKGPKLTKAGEVLAPRTCHE
ncbi:MAG: hypothetical protein AAFP85_02985 [Pseudomonadota bacterium]